VRAFFFGELAGEERERGEKKKERMMGLEPTTFCMARNLRRATRSARNRQARIVPAADEAVALAVKRARDRPIRRL
jgi:hypothetical protein